MKILRMFDSLKIMRAMFVAVACMFILNVAHAATTTINSVIAYGKTEQNGTPTPTNPVPIMTNNGVLKASPNLFDSSLFDTTAAGIGYHSFSIPNGTYTMSTNFPATTAGITNVFIFAGRASSGASSPNNGVSANVPRTITVTNGYYTVAYRSGGSGAGNNNDPKNFDWMLEKGPTATEYEPYGEIVTDGLTETIRDAAGHTAIAQMLLSVGDYKDEQNITTGAITRRVGVRVFDGTENWGISEMYSGTYRTFWLYPDNIGAVSVSAGTKAPVLSNYFSAAPIAGANNSTQQNNTISTNATAHSPNSTWIRTNDFSTVSEFKSWLAERYAAGTPVIVVYPLATETTENVATQSLTTAPVRQTAGSILGMPIEVVFGDGTREWVSEIITIATTKYNEESFAPVETRLDAAVAAVDTVVTQTMSQAQAIDTIATTKQTRPDEGCDAKYCLLVEDEDGTPHWYPIAGANGVAHNLPAGYTELQYIESTGTQYINTGYIPNSNTRWELDNEYTETPPAKHFFNGVYQAVSGYQPARFDIALAETGLILNYGATNNVNSNVSSFINTRYMYVVDAKNNKWAYNDTTGSFPSYSNMATITKPLYLFARNDSSGVDRFTKQRTYSSKIYDDGILVRDFVPAKNSSGVVGMYDMVSGQFFTNQGTGDFTAGPDM